MTPADLTARGVRVKPLVFTDDRYCSVDFGPHLTFAYSITELEYGLEEVDFRVFSSEWGPDVIWRGPKGGGVAAAQADYEARIYAALEPADATPEVAALIAEAEARGRIVGLDEAEKIAAGVAGNVRAFNADRRRGAGEVQAALRAAKAAP